MKDYILCPYFEQFNNTAVCICPDGYYQEENIICVQNVTNVSDMIYSSNYTFTIIVTALLIIVFIRTVTSMGSKENTKINIFNSDDIESNDTRIQESRNRNEYRTCCFCWKYKKPSYQYKKRRRFIHLEQSLYVLGKTQAQAHA